MAPDLHSKDPIFNRIQKLFRHFHVEILGVVKAMNSVEGGRVLSDPRGWYEWRYDQGLILIQNLYWQKTLCEYAAGRPLALRTDT